PSGTDRSRLTEPPVTGILPRVFAWVVIRLRWLIVLAWIAAAIASVLSLPPLGDVESEAIGDLVPANTPAVTAERASARWFDFPILTRTAIVQRNPQGLSPQAQPRVAVRAPQLSLHPDPVFSQIAGAFPITNTLGIFPGSRERSTTAITYLFFGPD